MGGASLLLPVQLDRLLTLIRRARAEESIHRHSRRKPGHERFEARRTAALEALCDPANRCVLNLRHLSRPFGGSHVAVRLGPRGDDGAGRPRQPTPFSRNYERARWTARSSCALFIRERPSMLSRFAWA